MSGKSLAPRKSKPRPTDERVRRTCFRLGQSLLELITEKPIHSVTVQEVLKRAKVGRSTFYLHYRDKNDLLFTQLEEFCELMSTALSVRKEKSHRVAPVAEMFDHVGIDNKLYRALADGGHLPDFFDMAQEYFARGIERRLIESGRLTKLSKPELSARGAALAGSLLALLRWWIDHRGKPSPREMDDLYHRMVWAGVQ